VDADEAGKVLGLMALADGRKPPADSEGRKAMIAFWLSEIGDLPYADAAQAVHAHYRESTDWCMPAHIRRRVAAMRAERLRAAGNLEELIPEELADRPLEYRQRLSELTEAARDGQQEPKAIGDAR
jgi:hypothetical protein